MKKNEKKRKKKKRADSRFSQQELRSWEGRPTRAQAAAILFAVGIALIPLGVACLFASASVRKMKEEGETFFPFFFRFSRTRFDCKGKKRENASSKNLTSASLSFPPFLLFDNKKVVEVRARYDDACSPGSTQREKEAALLAASAPPLDQSAGDADGGLRCTLSLPPLPRGIARGPVYLAYELTAFHQNHRRYVRSRSEAQLRGGGDGFPWEDGKKRKQSSSPASSSAATTTSTCAPRETTTTGAGASSIIVPCGLVAWSNFNDTFSLEAVVVSAAGGNNATTTTAATIIPLSLDAAPLRSPADLRGRFSPRVFPSASFDGDPAARGGGSLPANQSLADAAALQVWMRPAALPSFRKPAGVVVVAAAAAAGGDDGGGAAGGERRGEEEPLSSLPAGAVVRVTVANRFNSYRYGGTKSVVLTTRSWLGGRNPFLGWAGVGVGGGCVAAAAALALVAAVEASEARKEEEENRRS